jgi:hypothetical protein
MQRHRKARRATVDAAGDGIRFLLEIAHAQVEAMDREIHMGRPSGQGLRDELVRMIKDTEDRLAGIPIKLQCDRQQSPAAWVDSILSGAEMRSGGVVEQHLVGGHTPAETSGNCYSESPQSRRGCSNGTFW